MGSAIGGAHCKVQGSHRSQDPKHQLQLAGEHPDLATAAEAPGAGIAAVQPEPALTAPDVEDPEVAGRVGDRLHVPKEPLTEGLVKVHQAQKRHCVRRELDRTELLEGREGLGDSTTVRVPQLGVRGPEELNAPRLRGHELGPAHQIVGPVADLETAVEQGSVEIGDFLEGAELDGGERRPLEDRSALTVLGGQPIQQRMMAGLKVRVAHRILEIGDFSPLQADALAATAIVSRRRFEGNSIAHGLLPLISVPPPCGGVRPPSLKFRQASPSGLAVHLNPPTGRS